ncbi:hydroxyacid oxidase [Cavenderia fasciculata]|uniref:Hydroxyacid oxidase n=1 Tax=Cavenderia fasciculata TaxID=261658 RepID=F4QDC7_CACFS|nr:hydroxyacid oxidase [Cavenderia fasciculata]EGG13755.1 hydroxyacid oxidase [Cavenderia fasciculata]|eukprot:XP_004350463.1 hydroxyacid oxidase [Cavenderia fasciculata]
MDKITNNPQKPAIVSDITLANSRTNRGQGRKSDSYLNIEEFRIVAERKLPRMVYDYYASGSDNQITLGENVNFYSRIKLTPRCLVDVSNINTKTSVFGIPLSFPVMIAPTAMQKMAHPNGEIDTCLAARDMGTLMTLSSLATTSVEDLGKASGGNPGWFQLYVFKDRSISEKLVKRAEMAGFKAILLTIDTPFLGRRESDYRNEFSLPTGLQLRNFTDLPLADIQGGLNKYMATMIDSSLTWNDLAWLKSITKLPVIVKGVMCPQDALLAVKYGADGIIVSNHGARQLDTSPSTIEVLPYVVRAVGGRIPVIVDGGVRRGTDILKALAYGACAVMIGRPVLWGLAADGYDGVLKVLQLLRDELVLSMALAGVNSISKIDESLIWSSPNSLPRPKL